MGTSLPAPIEIWPCPTNKHHRQQFSKMREIDTGRAEGLARSFVRTSTRALEQMPTMAMERNPLMYSTFSRGGTLSAAAMRKQHDQAEADQEASTRASLVRRANAITAIADMMEEQNARMLCAPPDLT